MPDPELLQRLARRAVELEMTFEGDVLVGPGPKMAGKKERRSQKDKAKARKLKHGPAQKAKKTRDQKAIQKAMRKQQVEQGQAGLAGAGRGGKHKDKKRREESDRKRKHKGKPVEASIKRVADAHLQRTAASG